MTVMTSRVADDDGAPLPGVYVRAELVGSRWLAGHAGVVDGSADTYTSPDGWWSLDLTPADELQDADSWWRVRIWQRATLGLNVPPDPGGPVDVSTPGVLRPAEPGAPDGPALYPSLDQLTDVDAVGATTGQVLVRGEDGVWYPDYPSAVQWGDPVAFAESAPDPETAPASAVWVELGSELMIYRKAP